MYFFVDSDENIDVIWQKIIETMSSSLSKTICPSASSFITTNDGLECIVRTAKGELLANCYSEDNRMGGRRWTIMLVR